MATLRTKTGCLTCRIRRKKCDETHDRCYNCVKHKFDCVWPTKEQVKDKRSLPRKHTGNSRTKLYACNVANLPDTVIDNYFLDHAVIPKFQSSPAERIRYTGPAQLLMVPAITEESKSRTLFTFFVHNFLPTRIRPQSRSHFFRFSYIYDLAPRYSPLLNACLACATSVLGTKLGNAQAQIKAIEFYSRSIQVLRTKIQKRECEGSEDWLLATVVILCLFENQRPGYDPVSATTHITAASQVFTARALKKVNAASHVSLGLQPTAETFPALIFERMFTESFLYHCMVISIRDKKLTPLQDPLLRRTFDTYFECCKVPVSPEPENWPIFGMHYHLVRLLSDLLTSLDKSQKTVNIQWSQDIERIIKQLEIWNSITTQHGQGLHVLLYISAAKLLAYCHLRTNSSTPGRHTAAIQQELDCSIRTLSRVDFTQAVTRYFNWPFAIIDTIVQDPRASHIIQQKLKDETIFDVAAKKSYDWVAEGFEQRFNPSLRLSV